MKLFWITWVVVVLVVVVLVTACNQAPQTVPEAVTPPGQFRTAPPSTLDEGFYYLNPDQPSNFDAFCKGQNESRPPDSRMRAARPGDAGDKIPLVLIHGWTALADRYNNKTATVPALCYWQGAGSLLEAYLGPDLSLRDRYALFSFGYNSYNRVLSNAVKLNQALRATFGNRKVVVVAHSMGGLVTSTYMKYFPDHLVENVITLGTPFRGTAAFLCSKAGSLNTELNTSVPVCDKAEANPALRDELGKLANNLVSLLEKTVGQDEGTLDLAWQPGSLPLNNKQASVPNAFLTDLEYLPQADKRRIIVLVGKAQRDVSLLELSLSVLLNRFMEPAMRAVTLLDNDGIVPAVSACWGPFYSGLVDNSCANAPVSRVLIRPLLNHLELDKDVAGIKPILFELAGAGIVRRTFDAGARFALAIRASDGVVLAWGQNSDGQLGNGTRNNSSLPLPAQSLSNIVSVAAGSRHALALDANGLVYAWGANYSGQLGLGQAGAMRLSPTRVPNLQNIIAISAGDEHSLALGNDGKVFAWGDNQYGELGNGTIGGLGAYSATPTAIANLGPVSSITAGAFYSTAILQSGALLTWGDNSYGQLGIGSRSNAATPQQVLTSVTRVVAGRYHTMAMQTSTVMVWGYNFWGALGTGDQNDALAPKPSQVSSPRSLTLENTHTLFVKGDGSVWAIGDFSGPPSITPTPVTTSGNFASVSSGLKFALALRSDGALFAWGANESGQLGNGTTNDQGSFPTAPILTGIAPTNAP